MKDRFDMPGAEVDVAVKRSKRWELYLPIAFKTGVKLHTSSGRSAAQGGSMIAGARPSCRPMRLRRC